MPGRSFVIALVLFSTLSIPANSQTVATKDTTAISLLSRAVGVLASGVPINSITLTATVTRTAGSDVETGTATLEALGGAASRVSMSLSDGQQSEVINQSQGDTAGQWSGADATVHPMAQHNCWIPASWFFPALVMGEALNDPSVSISYSGQETRDGVAVEHIRFWRVFASDGGSAAALTLLEHLTAADVYLDAATSAPVDLDFNIHPDNNAAQDIPVEIQYSGYQKMSGIFMPARVQKFINNSLFLDLNITGAALNTSISPAEFGITTQAQ